MVGLIFSIFIFILIIIIMDLSQSNIYPPSLKDIKEYIKKNTKRYGK